MSAKLILEQLHDDDVWKLRAASTRHDSSWLRELATRIDDLRIWASHEPQAILKAPVDDEVLSAFQLLLDRCKDGFADDYSIRRAEAVILRAKGGGL